jgi:hypothetical protein
MTPPAKEQPPRWMEYRSIDDLPAADRNPKGHDSGLIGESYAEFGYLDAVIVDERTGKLVSGHGRLERLRWERGADGKPPEGVVVDSDGNWTVPVQRGWASRDDDHASKAVVVINRAVERGGWQSDMLGEMLEGLVERGGDEALVGTGYALDDLDTLLSRPPAPLVDAGAPGLGDVEYRIVVTCDGEAHQAELLERLQGEGLTCRAIAQ